MTLWGAPGVDLDEAVLSFTVGDDPSWDMELLPYDCLASAAHATMLGRIGVLAPPELEAVLAALGEAYDLARAGELSISVAQEDGHTALEQFLTECTGEAGLKIHTGRSRNDQVIAALRLLVRERLLELAHSVEELVALLGQQARAHRDTLMPGYTHTRQAMPSTVGHLLGSVAEGLVSDLDAMAVPLAMSQRGALGSASGYGVPLPLDRALTAELLGLEGVDVHPLHVQNTRGRLEAACIFALHQLSLTLGRFCADLIWFSSEAFQFFRLPDALTTGSSIMPQKRNPDVLELVRAMPSSMLARYTEVTGLLHGLPGGYHRDLQRTKAPMLSALKECRASLFILEHLVRHLEIDAEACQRAMRHELYATDRVYARVRNHEPFREAYRAVKGEVQTPLSPSEVLEPRTHLGAPGTDAISALEQRLQASRASRDPIRRGAEVARALLEPS